MRLAAVVLVLSLTAPAAAEPAGASAMVAPAEQAERLRLADLLIAEAGVAASMDRMRPQIVEMVLPALAAGNSGREADIRTILTEELDAALEASTPTLIAKSRDLYAERFTASELGEILAFNRSAVGQKANRVMPEIQMQMMAFGQQAGQAAMTLAMPRILDRLRAADIAAPRQS